MFSSSFSDSLSFALSFFFYRGNDSPTLHLSVSWFYFCSLFPFRVHFQASWSQNTFLFLVTFPQRSKNPKDSFHLCHVTFEFIIFLSLFLFVCLFLSFSFYLQSPTRLSKICLILFLLLLLARARIVRPKVAAVIRNKKDSHLPPQFQKPSQCR